MNTNKQHFDLLIQELEDLWGIEHAIITALPLMIDKSNDQGLKNILRLHFAETLNQTSALRGIFKQRDLTPKGELKKNFQTILENGESTISSAPMGYDTDLKIIYAAKQIERYEIERYTNAVAIADKHGLQGVKRTLLTTLNEEKLAKVKLDFLEKKIGELASQVLLHMS
jgi:ferritin-like metal-binding protein YciE